MEHRSHAADPSSARLRAHCRVEQKQSQPKRNFAQDDGAFVSVRSQKQKVLANSESPASSREQGNLWQANNLASVVVEARSFEAGCKVSACGRIAVGASQAETRQL